MATNIELEILVRDLQERVAFLESVTPAVATKRQLERQRLANEAQAKKQAEEDAEAERQRQLRGSLFNRELTRPTPKTILCERSGEYIAGDVVCHPCENGRCVHDVRKAKYAGLITKEQFEMIVEEGNLETGCIIPISLPSPVDPGANDFQVQTNPLTEQVVFRPIVHHSGGV